MNGITPPIRQFFLEDFCEAWANWSYSQKPVCFWLREYGEVAKNKLTPRDMPWLTWADRVWLLDENGLHERNILDWRRFALLVENFGVNPFHRGVHEVATGYFAPTSSPGWFYSEKIWGGLWGTGTITPFDADGQRLNGAKQVWIS